MNEIEAKPVAHTPGPWMQEYDGAVAIGEQVCIPVDHCGPDDVPHAERKANARLIAAAPDLLAALQMALDADQDSALWRETARAAIAKAREGAK